MHKYKKTFQNFSLRLSTNVFSKLLGLITLPIISRALGPKIFGKWNTLLTMLGYISIPFNAGIVTYGVREVAKGNVNEIGKILSSRILLCIISYLISLIVFYFFVDVSSELFLALVFSFLYLLSIAINIEYFYIGTSNFKLPAISQISGQVIYVICVFFFIKTREDFISLSIIYFSYYFIISAILLFFYPGKEKIKLNLNFKTAFAMLSKSYKLGISGIIENLSISMPIILISSLIGHYSTGIFAAAFKLIAILLLGFQTILTVLSPNLVKLRSRGRAEIISKVRMITLIFIGMGLLSSAFAYFFGEQIIHFVYGAKYVESIDLLKLFAVTYLPMLPLGMLFNTLLIYFEKDKHYLYTTLFSFSLLILVTPVLITQFNAKGAIFGMTLYMFSYMSISFFFLVKELRTLKDEKGI